MKLGRELLQIPIPKVVFMEPESIALLGEYDRSLNTLVPFTKDELILAHAGELRLPKRSAASKKDTRAYLDVQNNKTAWVKQAVELDPFSTDQFVWVDFGLLHIFNGDTARYRRSFDNLPQRAYSSVRIAHIWDVKAAVAADAFHDPLWYFAGGVFGGDRQSLLAFHDAFLDCLRALVRDRKLTWEVNTWYHVYMRHPSMFQTYYGDHDPAILENY